MDHSFLQPLTKGFPKKKAYVIFSLSQGKYVPYGLYSKRQFFYIWSHRMKRYDCNKHSLVDWSIREAWCEIGKCKVVFFLISLNLETILGYSYQFETFPLKYLHINYSLIVSLECLSIENSQYFSIQPARQVMFIHKKARQYLIHMSTAQLVEFIFTLQL